MADLIPLIGQDGKEYTVEPQDLDAAKANGYVVKGSFADVVGKVQGAGRAAIEGGLGGFTAGLGTAALAGGVPGGTEGEPSQAGEPIRRDMAEHPYIHTAGELAGMLASPVGAVGDAVKGGIGATTALGRIGAHVASGAAEGSLFGAGNAVSESALGDTDLTAEKLLAQGGLGAALGGLGGGIGGVVSEGVGASARKLADIFDDAKGTLKSFANSKAVKAAGATASDLKYLGPEGEQRVGYLLLDRGHIGEGGTAPNAKGVLASVQKDLGEQGDVLDKMYSDAHAAGARPVYSELNRSLDDFEAKLSPRERVDIAVDVQKARDALNEYGGRPVGSNDSGFEALRELKSDLQSRAKWSADPTLQPIQGLRRQLAGTFRDALEKQLLPQLGSDAGRLFTEQNALVGTLLDAQRVAQHGANRLAGNASVGLRDLGLGLGAGLLHGNPLTGIAAALGSKLVRERGPALAARLADSISDSPVLRLVADHFSSALQKSGVRAFSDFGPVLLNALAQGPTQALATHMTLATQYPKVYPPLAAAAGFGSETPEQTQAQLAKAHGLAQLKAAVGDHDTGVSRAIDRAMSGAPVASRPNVLKSQDFGAKRMTRSTVDSYQARRDEVTRFATNPQGLIQRVEQNIGSLQTVAPATAASVAATASRAVAFLHDKMPKQPIQAPLGEKWEPSPTEIESFSRTLQATQEPLSVLSQAANGSLTPEAVQAVETVYPKLYNEIRMAVAQKISDGAEVPYTQRVMLGMLTGLDVDGTMNPGTMQRTQLAMANPQEPAPGAAPKPQEEGMEKLGFARRARLRTNETDEEAA